MPEKSLDTESVPSAAAAAHDGPSPALITVPGPPAHVFQDAEPEITADAWESRNWLSED